MDFKNLKVDKEQVMKGLNVSKRVGKAVVVEGIKALTLKSAAKVITASFEGGVEDVKKIGLDDILGEEKPKKQKMRLFSKKKDEVEEVLEEVDENETIKFETVEPIEVVVDKENEVK